MRPPYAHRSLDKPVTTTLKHKSITTLPQPNNHTRLFSEHPSHNFPAREDSLIGTPKLHNLT